MAVTDPDQGANGISAFVVAEADDRGSPSAPRSRRWASRARPTRELYFDNCRIPGDRIIGEPGTGFKTALATLDHTRVDDRRAGGRASRRARWTAPLGYAKERKQFGKSIADFQGIQFMLADMAMKIEAARQMVYVGRGASPSAATPDLAFFGAAAKCFASDVAMEVTTDAVQLLGGDGYTVDFPVERIHARRQDHPDLRGHQPDPARRHVTCFAEVTDCACP